MPGILASGNEVQRLCQRQYGRDERGFPDTHSTLGGGCKVTWLPQQPAFGRQHSGQHEMGHAHYGPLVCAPLARTQGRQPALHHPSCHHRTAPGEQAERGCSGQAEPRTGPHDAHGQHTQHELHGQDVSQRMAAGRLAAPERPAPLHGTGFCQGMRNRLPV